MRPLTELGRLARKRLETLADLPTVNPRLPRVWREVIRAEAKALEEVINEWPNLGPDLP